MNEKMNVEMRWNVFCCTNRLVYCSGVRPCPLCREHLLMGQNTVHSRGHGWTSTHKAWMHNPADSLMSLGMGSVMKESDRWSKRKWEGSVTDQGKLTQRETKTKGIDTMRLNNGESTKCIIRGQVKGWVIRGQRKVTCLSLYLIYALNKLDLWLGFHQSNIVHFFISFIHPSN